MRSWLLLFGCNLMWALQFTCIKLVQDQVGPMFTVWGPMLLATLLLIPILLAERKGGVPAPRGGWRDVRLFLLLGALGVFPGQVLITWGTRRSLASNGALIQLTLPVCTAVMAYVFLGERMTRIRWLSFTVAIAGVVICSGLDFRSMNFGAAYLVGNLLIFAAALGSSFYNSYGKIALERYTPMEMLFWSYVVTLALVTPVVFVEERDVFARIPLFTLNTWIGMSLLTVFHNFLSMVLFLKALKSLDAIQAALSNYLITFFGVPIAAIWLGERLGIQAVAGGLLVLASTLLITVWEERRAKTAARPVVHGSAAGFQ
jgi:drug/metabolite transporter (DMT)-like permease